MRVKKRLLSLTVDHERVKDARMVRAESQTLGFEI